MDQFYQFAGVGVQIDLPDEKMYIDERVLAAFRVEQCAQPHYFRFRIAEELKPPVGKEVAAFDRFRVYREGERQIRYLGAMELGWEAAYARVEHLGKQHDISLKAFRFPERVDANIVLNCLAAEHLVARAGGFILHCSYIERNGKAVLFTAPSGTGKSTQAALWEKFRGVEVINGDKAAVRVTEDGIFACGIPFAGSSGICKNRTLPLAAIVYLSQAQENSIHRLTGFEAFRAIWEGCSINTWDSEDIRLVSEAVQRVLGSVPVFHLACRPDESAVTALEEVL